MTRAEQLAQKEARAKARLEKARKALTKVQSAERAEDRTLRDRRRVAVGTLAETAGLCALDDATLTELFALLASLAEGPSPGAVLERLMGEEAMTTTRDRKEAPWNFHQNSYIPQAGS
jgi:hypothetical protein